MLNTEISNKKVTFKKAVPSRDYKYLFKLRNNPKLSRNLNSPPKTQEDQLNWMRSRPKSEIIFIIYDMKNNKIGTISIYNIDHNNLICEPGRFILEKNNSEKLFIHALDLTYKICFEILGFRKLIGTVAKTNELMLNFHLLTGWESEGKLKEHFKIKGEYMDCYYISLFKENYYKIFKKKLSFEKSSTPR